MDVYKYVDPEGSAAIAHHHRMYYYSYSLVFRRNDPCEAKHDVGVGKMC